MRSISRTVDVSINTVTRELVMAGGACADFHRAMVRNVKAKKIQCDEIWSWYYAKAANVPAHKRGDAGDVWTWTAIDADSKLIVSWLAGSRDADCAHEFMRDLQTRLANRVQLTTDGHHAYLTAVDHAFGLDIDYSMLVKLYGETPESAKGRYSPAECVGTRKRKIIGKPKAKDVSTSYAERHNLTMRMSMRRFTRLTNAFSKKLANHLHALALYFVVYNWVRIHKAHRMTPAMASGLTDKLMDFSDIVRLTDAYEVKTAERVKKILAKIENKPRRSN